MTKFTDAPSVCAECHHVRIAHGGPLTGCLLCTCRLTWKTVKLIKEKVTT